MKLIRAGEPLSKAASKAGMDDKTARKYRDLGKLPSQSQPQRWWRTRADVFQEVWPEVEQILATDPRIEAVTIFEHLCRKYAGQFKPAHWRTLQRRVKVWRALEGKPKEVFFPQLHHPGLLAQSDFTSMNDLAVTMAGQPFDHLFYHFTLTFSNWETGSVCFSESFESLSAGLQNALWRLGAVPQEHRTDSLSAAVNNLSDREEFTQRYKGLLSHYGLRASHNNPGRANENGDVEQSHHRFKKAVEQALLLRGSRNFDSRQEYDEFLLTLLERRNASRKELLKQEMEVMRPLPGRRLDEYTRLKVRVSRNSTISVRSNLYSVSSQLISESVEVRLFSEKLEVWYGGKLVESLPRLRGQGKHAINYRHIIDSLVRKPGAMANYRWRSDLFPRLMFRVAYDSLRQHSPRNADKQYVKILHLAARESEQRVDEALRELIERGEAITEESVREIVLSGEEIGGAKLIDIAEVKLSVYDQLLESKEVGAWWRQSNRRSPSG